jgi:hypothetical protein
MTNMMKMINFLKAKSALRHRKLRQFLGELDAQYTDLLAHNNVRWLSKGSALTRIWELRDELTAFLDTCGESGLPHLDVMRSIGNMTNLAFLVDILGHLNKLNLKQQGKGKSILELWSTVKSFTMQLGLFEEDLAAEMTHCPCLKSFTADWDHNVDNGSFVTFIRNI